MKMYYVTRYFDNKEIQTEFYLGGGRWTVIHDKMDRLSIRLYLNKSLADCLAASYTETKVHIIEIELL